MTRSDRLSHLSVSFFALTLVFTAQLMGTQGSSLSAMAGQNSSTGPASLPQTHASARSVTPSRSTIEQRRLIRLKKPVYRRATTRKATYVDSNVTL